jgi:hypothetical protein
LNRALLPVASVVPNKPAEPANVETAPPGVIARIVWLLVSPTYTVPKLSTATPRGELNRAGLSVLPEASRQARERRHHATGSNFPDRVIEGIGDVHVARAVDGGALRPAE